APVPWSSSSSLALRRHLEDLNIDVTTALQRQVLSYPDRAHRLVARARDIRSQISALEHRIGADRRMASQALQARETLDTAAGIVAEYGETIDHYEFNMLRKDFEAAAARLDERGVQRCITELDKLRF